MVESYKIWELSVNDSRRLIIQLKSFTKKGDKEFIDRMTYFIQAVVFLLFLLGFYLLN